MLSFAYDQSALLELSIFFFTSMQGNIIAIYANREKSYKLHISRHCRAEGYGYTEHTQQKQFFTFLTRFAFSWRTTNVFHFFFAVAYLKKTPNKTECSRNVEFFPCKSI